MPDTATAESSGAVYLELVLKDTLAKQIDSAAKAATKPAEKSLSDLGKNAAAAADKAIATASKKSSETVELLQKKLDNLYDREGLIQDKAEAAQASFDKAVKSTGSAASAEAQKAFENVTELQGKLLSTQGSIKSTEAALNKAADAPRIAAEKAYAAEKATADKAKAKLDKLASDAKKSSTKAIKDVSSTATKEGDKATSGIAKGVSKLGKTVQSVFKATFITATLYAFFRAFEHLMSNAMAKNKSFSQSLNTIKGNLQVAFTPVIEAITPLVNRLMALFAKTSTYFATFVAVIFGKTYSQEVAATKKMQSDTKKISAAAKSASRDFDELHSVDKKDDSSASDDNSGINYDALNANKVDAGPLNKFKEVLEKIRSVLQKLKEPMQHLWEKGLKPIAVWAGGKVKDALHFLKEKLEQLGDWFLKHKDSFSRLGDSLGRLWKYLEPMLDALWGILKSSISYIIDEFIDGLGILVDILPDVIDFLTDLFTFDWSGMVDAGKKIIDGLCKGLWDAWGDLAKDLDDLCDKVVDWVKARFGIHSPSTKFREIAVQLIMGLVEGVKDTWDRLKKALQEKFSALLSSAGNKIKGAKQKILSHIDNIKTGIVDRFNSIWNATKKFINTMINGVENMLNRPIRALNNFIDRLNSLSINIPNVLGGGTIGFSIGKFNTVAIPRLATGGIVNKPTLSMIGESGREAVVPLENNTGWLNGLTTTMVNAIITALNSFFSAHGSSASGDIILEIDGHEFARIARSLLNKYNSNKTIGLGVV